MSEGLDHGQNVKHCFTHEKQIAQSIALHIGVGARKRKSQRAHSDYLFCSYAVLVDRHFGYW